MKPLDRNPVTDQRKKRNARRIRTGALNATLLAATTTLQGPVLQAVDPGDLTAPTVTEANNPGSADYAATNTALATVTNKLNALLAAMRTAGMI